MPGSSILLILTSFSYILPFSPFLNCYNISSLKKRAEAVFFLPSLLPYQPKISISYSNPYGIRELSYTSLAFSYRKVGVGFINLGTGEINEKTVSLAFARQLSTSQLGVSFYITRTQYEDIIKEHPGVRLGITGDAAFFSYGFTLASRLDKYTPLFSSTFVFNENFGSTSVDLHMELYEAPCISFSQSFSFLPLFDIVIGLSQNPEALFLGLRTKGYISISYSFREIGELGDTHSIGVEYTLGQNYNTSTTTEKGGMF
ncbi:MAG TPA: hypothetical protein ENH14_01125 [candidate division WOR-3 bacterium]|uniref:Uncharacterized protein n=1 Tax=candidate division WOR-3 bacterium TaxID=2052148 RepID=A0A7V0Q5M3_UNCW3|nr:MAG: hypothetical protein DRQ03_03615 [Candidatus Hydrothermae bacterium]HDL60038.1 hypothetical protein [candidate division WOR-3 bacterium]